MDFTQESDIKKIGLKSTFEEVLNKLQLTDRQREIFILRYGRGFCLVEICAEIGYCRKTVSDELRIIREKMAQLE